MAKVLATVPHHGLDAMRDITAELKELRLYGMAGAWEEVAADENGVGVQTSRWLIEHLLQA